MTLAARTRNDRIAVTRPNWSDSVSVTYEFKTGIIASYHDYEQRESLRLRPRVGIEFNSVLTTPMYQRWFADMADPNSAFWVVCEWRKSVMTADAPAGSTTLMFSSLPSWMTAGARLVLSNRSQECLVLIDSTSGGTTVNLSSPVPTGFSFLIGDRAYLSLSARPEIDTEFDIETDGVMQGPIRFDCVPGETEVNIGAFSLTGDFETKDVLYVKPNWRNAPTVAIQAFRETFDPGRGKTLVFSPVERMKRVQKLGYASCSADDIDRLLALFIRSRGRRGSFWVPTWINDLTASVTAASGTADVVVSGTDFSTAYTGSDMHNVMIAWDSDNSTWQANRIASIADDGTDTTITFTDNWSFDITPDTKVSFLYLSRFATDIFEARYLTDSTAEIELAIEPIRNE